MAGVEGTDSQYGRMGVYTAEPGVMQNDRPVYRSPRNFQQDEHLFINNVDRWIIGLNHTEGFAGVRAIQSGLVCPTDDTSWELFYENGRWVTSAAVSVTCTPAGTLFGITPIIISPRSANPITRKCPSR